MKPRHDNAGANRDRMRGVLPSDYAGMLVLEAENVATADVWPLSMGTLEFGEDLPGLPVAVPMVLSDVSVSLMHDTVSPGSPIEFSVEVRRAGTDTWGIAATFEVQTE